MSAGGDYEERVIAFLRSRPGRRTQITDVAAACGRPPGGEAPGRFLTLRPHLFLRDSGGNTVQLITSLLPSGAGPRPATFSAYEGRIEWLRCRRILSGWT